MDTPHALHKKWGTLIGSLYTTRLHKLHAWCVMNLSWFEHNSSFCVDYI